MTSTIAELEDKLRSFDLPLAPTQPTEADKAAAALLDLDPVTVCLILEVWSKEAGRLAREKRGKHRKAAS